MKKLFLFLSFFLVVSTLHVWADLVITESQTAGDGSPAKSVTIYVTSNKFAVKDGSTGVIFLSDRGIFRQYDTQKKTYVEFTQESLKALKAKTDAIIAKETDSIRRQMKTMPADQKAIMQKALDQMQQQGDHYTFRRLGPDKRVNGYTCTPIEVLVNGDAQSQSCFAAISSLGISSDDMKVFEKFKRFSAGLGRGSSSGMFTVPGLDKFLGFQGFLIEDTDSSGVSGTIVTSVTSVKHQSVPSSVFTFPSGLTKQDIFGG